MHTSMKTKVILFTLLSAAFMCGIALTTPNSRGANTNLTFTCNAVQNGSSVWYYGEEDQQVSFYATFSIEVYTGTKFNVTYNNWVTWNDSQEVYIEPSNHSRCSYTYTLLNSEISNNVTARCKISKMDSDPDFYTPDIIINTAIALNPANATNLNVALRPVGAVFITWSAAGTDNVELNHWEIYRSTDGINYGSAIAGAANLPPTTFQYTDIPPQDVPYYYRVVARDRAGHGSTPTDSLPITPDRTVPSLSRYEINATSYIATGSRMNQPFGGTMKFKLTLSESNLIGYIILKTIYNGYPFQKPYLLTYNATDDYYWVDIKTDPPVQADKLKPGVYDVVLNFTDGAGNNLLKVYTGQISIYEPNPVLDALLIIAPIAAVGVVVGYIATKKLKQRRIANMQKIDTKGGKRRRGEIYKGASDLGRASGDEAEEILAKRRRDTAAPESKRKGRQESRPAPAAAAAPSISSSGSRSAAPIKEKEEKFDTISATAGTKEIRAVEKAQTIDTGKKVGFLEGRITNLENVMSIAANLVEMIPDSPLCDKCSKPLNPSWSSCPWCLTSAQSDELEMKLAISGIDGKKLSSCPVCRAPLQPGWVKCPYCATRKA